MFQSFANWTDLQAHIAQARAVYYHAPLDTAPRPVLIRKRFKNGKLRLDAGEVVFTADESHLSRFRFVGRAGRHRGPRGKKAMNITDIEIGMRVHGDDCAPEDADQGYVTAINYETGMVEVAWDSCQCSEQLACGLKPGPLPGR